MSNESMLMIGVIGGIAGWLAGLILRGTGYGVIGDIIVGLIGAFVGNWFVRAFHVSVNLGSVLTDRIVVSVLGATLLMLVIGMLRPRSLRERYSECGAAAEAVAFLVPRYGPAPAEQPSLLGATLALIGVATIDTFACAALGGYLGGLTLRRVALSSTRAIGDRV
jgi:uncharacterized membrane protein YeaQ/YmgE (transglycosylase-associated protein family)